MNILRRTSAILAATALLTGTSLHTIGSSLSVVGRAQAAPITASPGSSLGPDAEQYTNEVTVDMAISGIYQPNPNWNLVRVLQEQKRESTALLGPETTSSQHIIKPVEWREGVKVTGVINSRTTDGFESISSSKGLVTVSGVFVLHKLTDTGWTRIGYDKFSYDVPRTARGEGRCDPSDAFRLEDECYHDVTHTITDDSGDSAHQATITMRIKNRMPIAVPQ